MSGASSPRSCIPVFAISMAVELGLNRHVPPPLSNESRSHHHCGAATSVPWVYPYSRQTCRRKSPMGLGISSSSEKPLRIERASSPVGLPGLAMERKPSASYGSGRRSPVKPYAATTTGGSGCGLGGLDIPVRPIPRRSVSPINMPAGEEASTTAA